MGLGKKGEEVKKYKLAVRNCSKGYKVQHKGYSNTAVTMQVAGAAGLVRRIRS